MHLRRRETLEQTARRLADGPAVPDAERAAVLDVIAVEQDADARRSADRAGT
ncbi:hypothetical protein [Goekera deserti]|uniref:Uncharacterized protein n=1 Tax=Goekera deserti TaxID=2497753 RepID=A0A7K3WB03_9ACTN|nr:hypothetical protein [Goekera deserti]NDI47910.1 hypothetical protein [Goekera deserti]NEL53658.1 hypothetical protein [Goekera deserti]